VRGACVCQKSRLGDAAWRGVTTEKAGDGKDPFELETGMASLRRLLSDGHGYEDSVHVRTCVKSESLLKK